MSIAIIAGARPNFIKIAPLIKVLAERNISYQVIHTGQHYDYNMSDVFFKELDLPEPDYHLDVGSGSHIHQIGTIMLKLEDVLMSVRPSLVIVVGDVNSTLAGAIVAVKLGIPVAHIEAGLRSFDRSMPEELNRVVTDAISDLLFTPSRDANENLKEEGISEERTILVGNIMIDTLVASLDAVRESRITEELMVEPRGYIYITLHRPSNVDDPVVLGNTINALREVSDMGLKAIFPIHPRTRSNIERFNLMEKLSSIDGMRICEPLGYIDSIALVKSARIVLTDSGGLQEETTFLRVPCLTLRENTERPITLEVGTNRLLDEGPESIPIAIEEELSSSKRGEIPELWDGNTAIRIFKIISGWSL